jgi:hypothetical protein
LYPFWAKYEARGSLKKNDVVPLFYLTKTKTRNHQREKKIFYDKNGVAYKRVSKKDDKESHKFVVHRDRVIRDGVFRRMRNNAGTETSACAYDREQLLHILHEAYTNGGEITRA